MSSKFCRICANQSDDNNSKNLFEPSHQTILDQITDITGLVLTNDNNLPQIICYFCQMDLDHSFQFRHRCISTQNYLQTVFHDIEGSFINDESSTIKQINILDNVIISESNKNDMNLKSSMEIGNIIENENDVLLHSIENTENRKTKDIYEINNNVKKTEENLFMCEYCGLSFASRNHLAIHLNRHSGNKKYQCEICPDKFFTHSELKRHMRKHTGERPFGCRYCARHFTDCSTRIKHERTHTNERPYSCEQCAKAFTSSYILKNHMLTHTGVRSFQCLLCNKSFQRQTHLDAHNRTFAHKKKQMNIESQD